MGILYVTDPAILPKIAAPNLSPADSAVIACAMENRAKVMLSDNMAVRRVAEREGMSVIGTVGILTHARLNSWVRQLKPLLDQLIHQGFYLDLSGRLYQDALKRAGEC